MNGTELTGRWNQLKGRLKERWGRLTDDDLAIIEGRRDQFIGKLQEVYGLAKEEAERQLREFLAPKRRPNAPVRPRRFAKSLLMAQPVRGGQAPRKR